MKFNKSHLLNTMAKPLVISTQILLTAAMCLSLTSCRDGQVDEGCYWGPIPTKMERLKELKDKGVKTIVVCRLNPTTRVENNAHELGMNFVHIPTGLFVNPSEENIQKFVKVARDPALRPLYICDQVARDRTQFYAGIYGMVSQKWTADHASYQMYRNGLRHWWPWFYKYRHIIKDDEQEIHGETAFKDTSATH